ncbi:hypothetical protein FE784_31815 [Paenibacillus hemerocallicola]|uniref:Glycosyltransferase family 39 protein n=1 Tax=Paenibacillus hemerocallicola TaxID=1172614 RepID=A0A5C4SZP7_9BACL|nr:mannosyltransferase family protein [Paenibacillus hemerocallicola]TNJ62146.1 hypothetical protein FE784_31815 [Paenibacillus hemerocallicola]
MIKGLTGKLMLSLLLLLLISRVMLLFTGYVGNNLFSTYTEPSAYEQQYPGVMPDYAMKLPFDLSDTKLFTLKQFVKFDSFAYLNIAANGYDDYRIDEPHPPANWVFFPLYPIILSVIGQAVSLLGAVNPAIIGGILSNILLFFALVYIYAIGLQQQLSENKARTMLILMLIFPTSLFYSLPYTESLFLLLSAASIYYASDKRYALAFLAASLSTVTRVPGFINLFFVMGTVVLDVGFTFSKRYIRYALYSLLSLIPMGAYLVYMKWLTGDVLAPFHEQVSWYRLTAIPFENYVNYFTKPYFMAPGGWDNGFIAFVISTAVFLVYLAFLITQWKKLFRDPKQLLMWVYGALLIVIPFSSQPWYLASVVRYLMICIPFFLYLIKLTDKRENVLFAYQMLFVVTNVITTIGFFNDYYFMA